MSYMTTDGLAMRFACMYIAYSMEPLLALLRRQVADLSRKLCDYYVCVCSFQAQLDTHCSKHKLCHSETLTCGYLHVVEPPVLIC